MSFFSRKTVVFLTQNSLIFYKPKKGEFLKLLFPLEIAAYQEIINPKKFEDLLTDFLSQFEKKEKKDAILILSSNLVYSKVISRVNIKEKEKSEEEFIKSLPLLKSQVIIKTVPMGKDEIIFATNRNLYETVVKVFTENGFRVPIVAPVSLFTNNSVNHELTQSLLDEVRKESKALEVGNFLSFKNELEAVEKTVNEDEEDEESEPQQPFRQYIMLLISIAILIGSASYTLISFGIIKNPFGGKVNTSATGSASLTSVPTAVPTSFSQKGNVLNSSPKALTRQTVRIQILNGSGIEGQAGRIRNQFISNGYKEVELGNADEIKEITVIEFAKNVPEEIQNEVISMIEKFLSKPDVFKDQTIENFDIIITTGKE